jgi:hypothetical protein
LTAGDGSPATPICSTTRPVRADTVRRLVPLVGLVLLVALFAQLGPERILSLLLSLGGNLLVIIAMFACHECVRAVALSRCLFPGHRPHFRQLLRIRFLGELAGALTRTGPFVAEPARAWMLAGQAVHGAHAYGAAAGELIANSCTSALVTIVAIGFTLRTRALSGQLFALSQVLLWGSITYVVVAVVALAWRVHVIGAILRLARTLPLVGRRLRTDPIQVRQIEDAIMHALIDRPVSLVQVLLLEILAQSILVFEIYWTIQSMGVAVSGSTALLVEALTKAANVIQFFGVTEAGYAVVLNWLGLTAAVGFTLSLVKLLRSLTASALGLGLLARIDRSLQ